ncbi:hypothetical protein JCM16303_004416 [Sporobolomyces ruberrimus]
MHSPPSCPSSTPLPRLLQGISILLGQTNDPTAKPHKIGQPKPTLSSILSGRLLELDELGILPPTSQDSSSEEVELQCETGQTALRLLELVQQSLPTPPSTTTTTNTPIFSVTQTKHLQMLGGVIARWGIGIGSTERTLPNQFSTPTSSIRYQTPTNGKGKEGFVEIDEEEETRKDRDKREKEERLKRTVETLVKVLKGDQTRQLRGIVMPQVLLPLMGTLISMSTRNEDEEETKGFEESLDFLFKSNPLPLLLSHLLQLVSISLPSSPYRSLLTTHLTSLLLKPGGVRSLLIVVVGLGEGVGDGAAEEGRERKLEMVSNLLRNGGNDLTDSKDYFENILSQLFEILNASTTSTLSPPTQPSTRTSSAPRAPLPPPQSILSATIHLLTHFLISPPPSSSSPPKIESYLLTRFHSNLLPFSYTSPPSLPTSSQTIKKGTTTTVIATSSESLSFETMRLSIFVSNTPPHLLETVLKKLLGPILPLLFSLVGFLERKKEKRGRGEGEGGVGGIKSMRGIKRGEVIREEKQEKLREEVESLLYVYGKSVHHNNRQGGQGGGGTESFVIDLGRTIEVIEKGEEFGTRRDEGGEGEGVWEIEWGLEEREGGVEMRWIDRSIPFLATEELGINLPSSKREEGINHSEEEEEDFGIKVEPKVFVDWFKQVGRRELSAGIFLRWLDELRVLSGLGGEGVQGDEDRKVELAKKSVVRLQLVLKMVEELGSEILQDPKEIIAFVGNTLDVESEENEFKTKRRKGKGKGKERERGFGLDSLRIVDSDSEAEEEVEEIGRVGGIEEVEEGEFGGLGGQAGGKDEMVLTALTLLLAVLEANEDLSMSSTPLLLSINARLSILSESSQTYSSDLIPPLIREARMVLQIRQASQEFSKASPGATSTAKEKPLDGMEHSRARYQEALKLLQDPLLPVRAQGLHLLRSLIKPSSPSTSQDLLRTDPALLPAILSIFLSAITEEDSFLYLNAVQGLSTLVDVFGRQVIRGLVEVYTGGNTKKGEVKEVGVGEKGQREVDKRLRVGEALVQVVQRAGEALATLHDLLLPPLLGTLRQGNLPVPLRASAITVLATMVETSPVAMMPVVGELGEAMRQLLEIETVSYRASIGAAGKKAEEILGRGEEKKAGKAKETGRTGPVLIEEVDGRDTSDDEEDFPSFALPTAPKPNSALANRPKELSDPTTTQSRHPSLRRAALLFLSLLLRTQIKQRFDLIEKVQEDEMRGLGESLIRDGKLRMPGERSVQVGISGGGARGVSAEEGIGARERERLRVTLGFVRETDMDELVRFQAGQVLEEMDEAGL